MVRVSGALRPESLTMRAPHSAGSRTAGRAGDHTEEDKEDAVMPTIVHDGVTLAYEDRGPGRR